MRIIHLSYNRVARKYTDPWEWLNFLSFFSDILEALARYEEVMAIYHIDFTGTISHNGVTYHFPKFNRWQLLLPIQFNRYIRNLHPDVVVVHGLIFPWQILMLRWQVGDHLRILAQHHSERPLKGVRKYFQRIADGHIKAYFFASLQLGQRWVKNGLIADVKKIKEVPGASSCFYPIQKDQATSITKVSGEKVFLWVGRLDKNKDPLLVANTFLKFAKIHPQTRLYFIYQTFELLEELEAIVANLPGASDCIRLIGKVDHSDLIYWYNSADFIISSSYYEGLGIAVIEGMSCGCIPVLTDIPSFRMMTDGGRIGLLYEPGNGELLLTALDQCLHMNVENEKKKVLQRFDNAFSAEANAKKMMEAIYAGENNK